MVNIFQCEKTSVQVSTVPKLNVSLSGARVSLNITAQQWLALNNNIVRVNLTDTHIPQWLLPIKPFVSFLSLIEISRGVRVLRKKIPSVREVQIYKQYWRENMLGYLSADIICSEKPTVLREHSSRKTVSYEEQIMSKDKYPSIFSPQWRLLSLLR